MESAQLRVIAALTVVLLGLTAALAGWEPARPEEDPAATATVVEAVDPARAVGLRIEQAAGERTDTIVLAKQDGIWRVQQPFEADADVDRVIAALEALRSSARGVPVPGEPAAFGLAPPQVVVTATLDDGSEHRLALGNVAPVDWRTYALGLDGSVVAVGGKPAEAFLERPGEFRDHRIFRYDPGEVSRVAIDSANGLLEARKLEGGWFLTGFGRADLVELDAWITDLLDLRVAMFLDLDHETLDAPRFRVQVDTPAGTQELRVGRDTPYGPLVFWGEGLDGVVDPPQLRQLERGPTDVGVAEMIPFAPGEVRAIARAGAVNDRIERPADGWDEAPSWVQAARDAQLVYRAQPPAWGPVELTLTVEAERAVTVEIGPEDAEGFRPVRDLAGGSAMRVPAEELGPLFAP